MKSKLKDIDSVRRSGYWRIFWRIFIPLAIMFGVPFGLEGILSAFIISLPLCVVVDLIADRIGGWASLLYSGRRGNWSVRENMEGLISVARQQKAYKNYSKALLVINKVLRKDPDNPDALYLKAEILWEGYHNQKEAKICLTKLLQYVSEDDTLYNWASSLYANMLKVSVESENNTGKIGEKETR